MEINVNGKDQENRMAELKLKELKRTQKNKLIKTLVNSNGGGSSGGNHDLKTPKNIVIKAKDFIKKYNNTMNNKILKKTLENGKVIYKESGLTEENMMLHQ
jgi:ribosomal protein L25 (general stress protein Ctc)